MRILYSALFSEAIFVSGVPRWRFDRVKKPGVGSWRAVENGAAKCTLSTGIQVWEVVRGAAVMAAAGAGSIRESKRHLSLACVGSATRNSYPCPLG